MLLRIPKKRTRGVATPGVGIAITAYPKLYVQLTGVFRCAMTRLAGVLRRFCALYLRTYANLQWYGDNWESCGPVRLLLHSSMRQPEVIFGNRGVMLYADPRYQLQPCSSARAGRAKARSIKPASTRITRQSRGYLLFATHPKAPQPFPEPVFALYMKGELKVTARYKLPHNNSQS